MSEFVVHHCGPSKNHKCDTDGPWEYYMQDAEGNTWVTNDEKKARSEENRCTGASVTCSQCNLSAQELGLWKDQ